MKCALHSVLLVLVATTLATAGPAWKKVSDIAVSEDARLTSLGKTLYLYDDATVLRSENNGTDWLEMSETFPHGVAAFRKVGTNMYAFAPADRNGRVNVLRSDDEGATWVPMSHLNIEAGALLHDVTVEGTTLYAISNQRSIAVSWNRGATWSNYSVDGRVGSLRDFASGKGLWIACGSERTLWSADFGASWYETIAPNESGGGILQVEHHDGTIWAGCTLGTCRFDPQSRSWVVANAGLPVFASLVGTPTTLRSINGVLFGVFKTFNGVAHLLRMQTDDRRWVSMESAGLPPHNEAHADNVTVVDNDVYLYYFGYDIGFVGLYRGPNDAPTSVDEDAAQRSWTIGPNPATDYVHISTSTPEPVSAALLDLAGRELVATIGLGEAELHLTSFPPGMYYVRVTDTQGTVAKPIVISR